MKHYLIAFSVIVVIVWLWLRLAGPLEHHIASNTESFEEWTRSITSMEVIK